MTDRYVRIGGTDSGAGSTPATAWATLEYAFANVASGDDVYIGPGTHYHYEDTRAGVVGVSGSPIRFMGDPTGIETTDPAGPVIITSQYEDWVSTRYNHLIDWTGDIKFVEFHNLVFLTQGSDTNSVSLKLGQDVGAFAFEGVVIADCMFFNKGVTTQYDGQSVRINYGDGAAPATTGLRIQRCYFTDTLDLRCDDNAVASIDADCIIESCVFTGRAILNFNNMANGSFNLIGITVRNCVSAIYGITEFSSYNWPAAASGNTLRLHGLAIERGIILGSLGGLADSMYLYYCQSLDVTATAWDTGQVVPQTGMPTADGQPRGVVWGYEANWMYDKWFPGVKPYSDFEPVEVFGQKNVAIGGGDPAQVPTLDYYGRPFEGNRPGHVFVGFYNGDFVSTLFDVLYTWQDPDTSWGTEDKINETRSFNEATTSTNGSISTNYLHIEKPSTIMDDSNQIIQDVWIRVFCRLSTLATTLNLNFYTLNEAENLGGFTIVSDGEDQLEQWRDLQVIPNRPAGGWTVTDLKNLECRLWQTGGGAIQVQRILVYIDTGNHDSGAVASRGKLEVETTIVNDGDQSIKITRAGYYQTSVPVVAGTSITVSVDVYRTSDYTGSAPQLQVYNIPGGPTEQTDTDVGLAATWNTLSVTFTPVQSGFPTCRLVSRDTSDDGATYFDNIRWS